MMKFFTPKFDVEYLYQWSSKFSDCFAFDVIDWLSMILLWFLFTYQVHNLKWERGALGRPLYAASYLLDVKS